MAKQDAAPPTELPRIAPLSVDAATEAFEIAAGYRIELVASEPLVVDPIAFCFDARGRLIVVEMRGYSERRDDRAGRVVRLSDTDGDGRMDRRELLAERLAWPTAVACLEDGVLVAAAPQLRWFPADTQAAEPPQLWAEGFGTSNVQGLVNSLRWGLDLRLHGATSSSSAEIEGLGHDNPLRLGRRDFAIDPLRGTLEPVAGGGQHGMMIDPWGDKYVCSNSDHLQQVMLLPTRTHRASVTSTSPPLRRSIAADGPQADVFRISPVEPWRILRTHMRVSGEAGGPIEGGGRAAGYFTGATGVYVYDGDQWPETAEPTALVCDVGSNLVHRKRLRADGLWRRGERIDEASEFLRSRDIWFRPVQLGTGPDGALYIADMYREVIEHPKSLPPLIKRQVDLNSGNDRGRIWRVVAEDRPLRRAVPQLDDLAVAELIPYLDHANAWQRRTAGRLLLEPSRRARLSDPSVLRQLRNQAIEGRHAAGRLQTMAVLVRLEGLEADRTTSPVIDVATWRALLGDAHPRVRQRALQWLASSKSELRSLPTSLLQQLRDDDAPHVAFQLAYDAGALVPDVNRRAPLLADIAARYPADPWILWAVEGSLGDAAEPFVTRLLSTAGSWEGQRADWLAATCSQWTRRLDRAGCARLVALLQNSSPPARDALTRAVAAAVTAMRPAEEMAPLVAWVESAIVMPMTGRAAESAGGPPAAAELQLIRWAEPAANHDWIPKLIERWLRPERSGGQQRAVLEHLVADRPEHFRAVGEQLSGLTPAVQAAATARLARTRQGMQYLAEQLSADQISWASVDAATRERLQEFAGVSAPSGTASSAETAFSTDQFANYQMALRGPIDRKAGLATFKRLCSTCHRVAGVGNQVGPDLKSLRDKAEDQILLSIMDPNREIDPRYRLVQIETVDGRIFAGIIERENDSELLLIDGQAKRHRVAREEIAALRTTDRSLMPTGLFDEITPDQMRHLIGLLKEKGS